MREHFRKFDINLAVKKIQAAYRGYCVRKLLHLSFCRFQNISFEIEKSLSHLSAPYKYVNGADFVQSDFSLLPLFFVPQIDKEEMLADTIDFPKMNELHREEAWLQKALLDRITFLKSSGQVVK